MCPVLQPQLENRTRFYWKTSSLQVEAQYDETAPLTTPHHPLRIPRSSADPLGLPAEHWTLLISSAVLLRDIFFFNFETCFFSYFTILLLSSISLTPGSY